ncbi:MAG: hypothetical protein ACFFCM_07750 [Promethearchaeota archaeon]
MEENNVVSGLSKAYFLISLASIVIWIYLYPIFLFFYVIGSITLFISGLLFISGANRYDEMRIGTAFGFGLISWILIIVSCFLGIGWNLSKINWVNFQNIILFSFYFNIEYELERIIFILLIISNSTSMSRRYRVGFTGSIIHIFIMIIEIILGSLALKYIKEEKW